MIICKNRIKPLLLRDIKTEALLVFIRTTLEDYFRQIENESYYFGLGSKEDNQFVYNELKKLLEKLQDTVINSSYDIKTNQIVHKKVEHKPTLQNNSKIVPTNKSSDNKEWESF